MPAPCAAPAVIRAVLLRFLRPFLMMEYQFSKELPWKQKKEPCLRLCMLKVRSLRGSYEIRIY